MKLSFLRMNILVRTKFNIVNVSKETLNGLCLNIYKIHLFPFSIYARIFTLTFDLKKQ